MPNPPKRLSAHQVYNKTLNLIFTTSKQSIKNKVGNFGAIYVRIMCAKFQPSSFNGVGGGGGDRRKDGRMDRWTGGHQALLNISTYKISKLPVAK